MEDKIQWAFGVIVSIIVEAVIVCAWAGLQFLVDYVVNLIPLCPFAQHLLLIFQYIFAVSTMIPVAIHTLTDLVKIYRQALERIGGRRRFRF